MKKLSLKQYIQKGTGFCLIKIIFRFNIIITFMIMEQEKAVKKIMESNRNRFYWFLFENFHIIF